MADWHRGLSSRCSQHVLIRFGRWQEIIDQTLPEDRGTLLRDHRHDALRQARVALAATGEIAAAEAEKRAFLAAYERRCRRAGCSTTTPAATCSASPAPWPRARWSTARATTTRPSPHLRRSVELDDALPYDEPWGWIQPTRHALGALLLEQGRVAEAEAVYRADLGLDGKLGRALPAPRQCLEPSWPARMPGPPRPNRRGRRHQAAPRPGRSRDRRAGSFVLLLSPAHSRLKTRRGFRRVTSVLESDLP